MDDYDKKNGNIEESTIQAYVFGDLDEMDAQRVAGAIEKTPELKTLANKYEAIRISLRRERAATLTRQLSPPDSSGGTSGVVKKPRSRGWLWVLALLIISVVAYFSWRYYHYQPVTIAQRHFQMPIDYSLAGSADGATQCEVASDNFFRGEFAASRRVYLEGGEALPCQTTAKFLLPHTAFLLGDYVTAAEEFTNTISDDNLTQNRLMKAKWNALITDLAQGENIESRLSEESWPVDWITPLRAELAKKR